MYSRGFGDRTGDEERKGTVLVGVAGGRGWRETKGQWRCWCN